MLIRFTDDYINDINAGLNMIGKIHSCLCCKEPFLGNSKALDKLYMYSAVIAGIVDHLMHDDNSNPKENESLLMCLRTLVNDDSLCCGDRRPPVIDVRNYHITVPVSTFNPAAGTPFDEGIFTNP